MNAGFEKLYQEMQADIKACQQKQLDRRTEIECCFQISCNYWSQVQSKMEESYFNDVKEEIRFYKIIKPGFTSSIGYYNLVYQAELLKPIEESLLKEYWMRESLRPDRFLLEHKNYIDYYLSGRTDLDDRYFLQAEEKRKDEKHLAYEEWIGQWLALQRYRKYIDQQLATS